MSGGGGGGGNSGTGDDHACKELRIVSLYIKARPAILTDKTEKWLPEPVRGVLGRARTVQRAFKPTE